MELSLDDILEDLHAAERICQEYERKYGVLTEDFYQLYVNGELECHKDFGMWAAYHEIKKHREEMLRQRYREDGALKERLLAVTASKGGA